MTIDQFRERMATDEPIIGGSDLHMQFHQYSQEALRITAEINGSVPHARGTATVVERVMGDRRAG